MRLARLTCSREWQIEAGTVLPTFEENIEISRANVAKLLRARCTRLKY